MSQLKKELEAIPAVPFSELWERHQSALRRACMRWTSGREDLADEALSRVALLALEKHPRQAAKIVNGGAWLTRLTHNVCMDLHRENHRRRTHVLEDSAAVNALESSVEDGQVGPESRYLRGELRAKLRRAIAELPPRLSAPLQLLIERDLSYGEIAGQLAITSVNLRKRLQEGRQRLRPRLAPYLRSADRWVAQSP